MALRTFEDFPVRTEMRFGSYPVTREEVIAFAREFDPQPFHLDEAAGLASPLKGLAASGFHTCAMTMRMCCDGYLVDSTGLGAPGIDELRWVRPVRPGMVLSTIMRVTSARVSRSRPEMGLVGLSIDVRDQTDTTVMTQRYTAMFGRARTDMPDEAPSPEAARKPPLATPEPLDAAQGHSRFAAFYEDVVIGARMLLGSYHFDRADMIRFATAYDPQPFHLSDEAAARTHFGRLAASGWHTAAAYMRSYVATRDRLYAEAEARGQKIAPSGPSPGLRDVRWLQPVFVDDTITYDTTVIDKRPHSRPGWGVVSSRASGTNQEGVKVYESVGSVLLPMRA